MRHRRGPMEELGMVNSVGVMESDDSKKTGTKSKLNTIIFSHKQLWQRLHFSRMTSQLCPILFLLAICLALLQIFRPSSLLSDKNEYDVFHCPESPLPGYPREYPILDVLQNWNTTHVQPPSKIYQGICVFDFSLSDGDLVNLQQRVRNYRAAEVPFVVRGDPEVLQAVKLWNDDDNGNDASHSYLSSRLANKFYQATLSSTTTMTYYSLNSDYNVIPDRFQPPTKGHVPMTFEEWYKRAESQQQQQQSVSINAMEEYAYLRLDACLPDKHCDSTYRGNPQFDNADFIYEDLSFFNPPHHSSSSSSSSSSSLLYDIDMNMSRGIQCRFGTSGLTAETHFDNERNYIAMIKGRRRFLLSHPRNCPTLYLYPQKHPLERHTQVDFSSTIVSKNNTLILQKQFPNFDKTTINELILEAGDVLYLPTYYFHHIISLDINYQCNTRSGYSVEHDQTIYDCGFFYDFPS